ncbi:MAG: hypothetical protein KAH77_00525 [Thiomargarita sp.]|nr:hypothetical protein [Thiomargarita sp.]
MSKYKDEKYQERLQDIANLALDVVELLMGDMETGIETRLSTAFRVIELCGMDRASKEIGQAIANGIQKNASVVENNAKELANLEAIIQMKQGALLPDKDIDPDKWSIVRDDLK